LTVVVCSSRSASTATSTKPKLGVGICHPLLGRGGSEAAALWAITELKQDYDVSLVTAGDVDLEGLNEFYGTALKASDFALRQALVPFFMRRNATAAALRRAYYQRFCRQVAPEFDLMISTYNFCDFGVPAIHFVADFTFDGELSGHWDARPRGLAALLYGNHPLRKAYLWLCRRIRRPSGRDFMTQDLTLANSRWTAGLLKERYGIEAGVLYPPVAGEFPAIPFAEKEDGFVFIGRVAPEKRVERVVEILSRVRGLGHGVHLHLIGQIDGSPYGRMVRRLCAEQGDWIHAEGSKSGEAKWRLIAGHRYGINARLGEAFGISVAEQVKAGSIVFVPEEGGQAEIVGHPLLTYGSVGDAVGKVDRVLREGETRRALLDHLSKRADAFSIPSFRATVRAQVEGFIQARAHR